MRGFILKSSIYVKFKAKSGQKIGNFIADDNTYFLVWTTTPWTLPGNVALAVGEKIEYVVLKKILSVKSDYGKVNFGKGEKMLIEHTSINPNASPHVGRARNAMIGDTLTRILRYIGYNVESHYYVNDVGKQIALMVYYSRMKKIKKLDFSSLLKLYIEANEWQVKNPGEEEKVLKLLWT